jgi:hypothetical protein
MRVRAQVRGRYLSIFVSLYCYVADFDCYVCIGVVEVSRQQQRLEGGLRQK